jgi:predicted PurR-regulated permease PerM
VTESVNNRHGNGLVLILLALSILAIVWLFTPFIAYLFLSLLICISTFSSFDKLAQKQSKNRAALMMTLLVTVLLILLALSILAIVWLFTPFIAYLFLSLLICISTFSSFDKLAQKQSKNRAALMMTLLVTVLLILPLGYILLVSGIETTALINRLQSDFQLNEISRITDEIIMGLPLSDSIREFLDSSLRNNLESIAIAIKDFSIVILKSITKLSSQFVFFVIITIFSLYYFYIDGPSFIEKIRKVSPLDNKINDLLLNQFSGLSLTLVGSVFLVALTQGIAFAIGAMIVGLPALFFGVAMALASFIPILGGVLVWLPISIYLFAIGEPTSAIIIIIFGAIIAGTIIDNFLRPVIIMRLSSSMKHQSPLNHTLITVLSTLAGIIKFGILGLFIGPIIAAMSITIFDIYQIQFGKSK